MPRIIVLTEVTAGQESSRTLDERITALDLDNDQVSLRLIERLGWAVHDADEIEARA